MPFVVVYGFPDVVTQLVDVLLAFLVTSFGLSWLLQYRCVRYLLSQVFPVENIGERLLLGRRLVKRTFGQLNIYMLFCTPIIL